MEGAASCAKDDKLRPDFIYRERERNFRKLLPTETYKQQNPIASSDFVYHYVAAKESPTTTKGKYLRKHPVISRFKTMRSSIPAKFFWRFFMSLK
jgi:hypothetical protein